MKKFFLVLFCCLALSAQAQVAYYCMTYSDFVNNNWKPVDELTEGRSDQAVQIKFQDNAFKFKTGDKVADKIIKKEVLVINYGDQLFVNTRHLRTNDIGMDTKDYAQAFAYDGDKLCLMGYKVNSAALVASIGANVAGVLVKDTWLSISMFTTSTAILLNRHAWQKYVCYYLASEADEKGKIDVVRINDQFMEEVLADDPVLLEKYKAVDSSRKRQAASNVLPILMEKGLIKEIITE